MKRLFSCLILFLLAACSQGPDVNAVRSDVTAQLAAALPKADIEIVSLERRGSQKDTDAPEGESRRVIYFDTELKLGSDIDFGTWNSPGVSALISALGTGPRGIEGITSGGNKAGDLITAHGTALYRQEGKQWTLVAPAAYTPGTAQQASDLPKGPAGTLATIWNTLKSFPPETSPEQNRIIEDELRVAQRNIQARLARSGKGYAVAAGAERGQYLSVSRALFASATPRTISLITHGSEENLQLLRNRKVSFALAQGDAAHDAYEGTGAFSNAGPNPSLRSIGSLYPEPFQVLARADSKLASVSDLRGKRVAIGGVGAASRTTALRVLKAHGLEINDVQAVELSIGGALAALRLGEIDAVMQVIGTPADAIRELYVNTKIRLLPLADNAVAKLVKDHEGYFEYEIARGTYPGQEKSIHTVATAALLLTDTSLSEAEIEAVTKLVYAPGRDFPGLGSAQGAQISPSTSTMGLSIPQHPIAARVLETIIPSKPSDDGRQTHTAEEEAQG